LIKLGRQCAIEGSAISFLCEALKSSCANFMKAAFFKEIKKMDQPVLWFNEGK
jgi:hypothetical protein